MYPELGRRLRLWYLHSATGNGELGARRRLLPARTHPGHLPESAEQSLRQQYRLEKHQSLWDHTNDIAQATASPGQSRRYIGTGRS